MVSLGLKTGAAGWKAQTNPLSHGMATPPKISIFSPSHLERIEFLNVTSVEIAIKLKHF